MSYPTPVALSVPIAQASSRRVWSSRGAEATRGGETSGGVTAGAMPPQAASGAGAAQSKMMAALMSGQMNDLRVDTRSGSPVNDGQSAAAAAAAQWAPVQQQQQRQFAAPAFNSFGSCSTAVGSGYDGGLHHDPSVFVSSINGSATTGMDRSPSFQRSENTLSPHALSPLSREGRGERREISGSGSSAPFSTFSTGTPSRTTQQ